MVIETFKGRRLLKFSKLRYGDKSIERVGVMTTIEIGDVIRGVDEESNYIFPDDINLFQEKYKVDDATLGNIKNYLNFRSGY